MRCTYEILSNVGVIKKIPKSASTSSDLSKEEMFSHLETLKDRDVVLQAGIYSSIIGYQILETRNVPDELFVDMLPSIHNFLIVVYLFMKSM